MGLPVNGRADTGACSCGDTVPLDDTLPLGDDEIEILETQLIGGAPNLDGDTQLLGGAPDLDGETQLLDDSENPAVDVNRSGNDNMVEYEGTEVVGNDDEGTERTMLLGDEDGLSDDAATPFGVKFDDGEGETEDRSKMGTGTRPPLPRLSDGGMEEFAVAFEASQGDEGGSGWFLILSGCLHAPLFSPLFHISVLSVVRVCFYHIYSYFNYHPSIIYQVWGAQPLQLSPF